MRKESGLEFLFIVDEMKEMFRAGLSVLREQTKSLVRRETARERGRRK